MKSCPNCENVGWYVVVGRNGEPEQEQCQFCYCEEDSVFNAMNKLQTEIDQTCKDFYACRVELDQLRNANKWVSVSERLPEPYQDVLIFMSDIPCAEYGKLICIDLNDVPTWKWSGYFVTDVTHWQPLPTPPTGGENGK